MPTPEVALIISRIGLASQVAITVLLVILFALLSRQASRRPYFLYWGWGWAALAVGLGALFTRFFVLNLGPLQLALEEGTVRYMNALYQAGKVGYLALLLGGVLLYVHGRIGRYVAVVGLVLAVGAGVATLWLSSNLAEGVVWQAPVTLLTYAAGALILLRLPVSRQSLGTRFTGLVLLSYAATWTVYFWAFLSVGSEPASSGALASFTLYNAFVDGIMQMLLAFGMVLILLEDARRETEDAHEELAVAHQALKSESLRDSLTRALNRRAFNEGAGLEAARAGFGTVIVFDLDNLKRVNDTHGHQAGDALLRYFVEILRPVLRPTDKLFRFGGDEFLLVMPRAQRDEVVNRFHDLLAAVPPLDWPPTSTSLRLQVSLGAAVFTGGERLDAAVTQADREMYAQKRQHKLFDE